MVSSVSTILCLSRRAVLSGAVLFGALGLFALEPVFAAPRTDLKIGMNVEPTGLDPTIAAPVSISQVVWQNLFEGLVSIDESGKVQPQLAESWTISEDGKTYTFLLQEGVKFHDGEVFDAATAKFTLDRARAEQSVNPQKRFFSKIQSVEKADDRTLVVQLSEPTGSLLYWLGWPASVMVGTNSAETNKTMPVGTGPFKFVNWTKGDSVELARFEDYWDKSSIPQLDKVVFRFISDPQAQAAAARSKDVDAFPQFSAPELFSEFENDEQLVTFIGNTQFKVVAGMNNKRKPFDDKRVRQALMMAVDREMLIDGAWSGFGTQIGSHYTPNDKGYVDLTSVHSYNPDASKALLAEAGYPNGFSFTMKAPQMPYAQRSAQVLQALFADVGIDMKIETTEFPAKWVSEVLNDANYDMTIVAHAEPMDIDIYARKPYYFNYENTTFNELMKDVELATSTQDQEMLYEDAQRILAEDVPSLFLFVMPKLGVWDKKLKGLWINEPIPSNVLKDVYWEE